MTNEVTCQRCGGGMQTGFVVDHTYGTRLQSQWAPGEPKRNWLSMVKISAQYPISTYRCVECGWLDSYARETGT